MGNSENKNVNISLDDLRDDTKLGTTRWLRACIAGSVAGVTEHLLLYPVDTIKTRMQAVLVKNHTTYKSPGHAFVTIIRYEGVSALFRGLPAVLSAAVVSHAAYFGCYEYSKHRMHLYTQDTVHHPFKTALAGASATAVHDLIVTPFDVVKQRMQLKGCKYPNVCLCAFDTLKREGYTAFFRSYPSTVLLNIPVFSTNFVVYESCKKMLRGSLLENEEYWLHHLLAGGAAGALSGLVSNPLDVIKTSIQTDSKISGYKTIRSSINELLIHNNYRYNVFFNGATARLLYMIPSASITWTTYEAMKVLFGFPIHDLERE